LAARENKLLEDIYTGAQCDALRRLIESLVPVNYENLEKIDIRSTIQNNKNIAFFFAGLNSENYAYLLMHEIYELDKESVTSNPSVEGRLLIIEECQKLCRNEAFANIYNSMVLDGRNYGINILSIFQNEKEANKIISSDDFILYKTEKDQAGKRIILINNMRALIVPICPGGKND